MIHEVNVDKSARASSLNPDEELLVVSISRMPMSNAISFMPPREICTTTVSSKARASQELKVKLALTSEQDSLKQYSIYNITTC